MKNVLLLLFSFFPFYKVSAEKIVSLREANGSITGRVLDEDKKKPLVKATITLSRINDRAFKKQIGSDELGMFRFTGLQKGVYLVAISFIGYKRYSSGQAVIRADNDSIDLGVILLKEGEELEEVKIVANNDFVTQKLDRIVVDVTKFKTTVGGNAVDVLNNSPGISIEDDGTMSLRHTRPK